VLGNVGFRRLLEQRVGGHSASSDPAVSPDGRYVAYTSQASNLVAGDTNNTTDVFVHDRVTRTTTRASVGTTEVQGNGPSRNPVISRDGLKVAFESAAANLIGGADTNGATDVFVGTRTGVQLRASQSSLGAAGNSSSRNPAISADGSAVAYDSRANNLVNGDTNSRADVFHHNLGTRTTTRVTNGRSSGLTNDPANGDSGQPSISFNGRVVAYHSAATNLVSGDTNGTVQDVYVTNLDRPIGAQNTLASVAVGGGSGNAASVQASLSSNG
jgi:Tol biopolymer transport system component